MTTEHDWPNEAPPVTVEHEDGTITHQGVRYVPEEHVEAMRLATIKAASDACTAIIKNYDVMKPDGKTYEPLRVQRAAKGMVRLARQDIEALAGVSGETTP